VAGPDEVQASPMPDRVPVSGLVHLIAGGDLLALAELYDAMAVGLREQVGRTVPDFASRNRVIAATMLEVWWLAAVYDVPGLDARAWIEAIAARRVAEHVRTRGDLPRPPAASHAMSDHDKTAALVLAQIIRERFGRATAELAATLPTSGIDRCGPPNTGVC